MLPLQISNFNIMQKKKKKLALNADSPTLEHTDPSYHTVVITVFLIVIFY